MAWTGVEQAVKYALGQQIEQGRSVSLKGTHGTLNVKHGIGCGEKWKSELRNGT